MKAERRQELRTNELAQQLDQIAQYVRQHGTVLTVAVAIAAVAAGGGYWFLKHRQAERMDAWAVLGTAEENEDPAAAVDRFREVARDDLEPAVTCEALLKTGQAALAQLAAGDWPAQKPAQERNWAQIARESYEEALRRYGSHAFVAAQAQIGLGIVAESQGDTAKAREYYQKIADDSRPEVAPFQLEAKYRLAGLETWSRPVEFPPPPPAGPPADASATQPAADFTTTGPAGTTTATAPAGR